MRNKVFLRVTLCSLLIPLDPFDLCERAQAGLKLKASPQKSAATYINKQASAPEHVSFQTPTGDLIQGDIYGTGRRGVILVAHGGYSSKESWEKQARILAQAGFRVLVFDTRASVELKRTGKETDCLYDSSCMAVDVLAAVRYLHQASVTAVSVVGGSAGGGAVAQACVEAKRGEIESIVLLAPGAIATPERMKCRKLFIATRDDRNSEGPRLPGIIKQYNRAPGPKKLLILEGSAHAQHIFDTPSGERVMKSILGFLSTR
jgi:dienelactone hydrolase